LQPGKRARHQHVYIMTFVYRIAQKKLAIYTVNRIDDPWIHASLRIIRTIYNDKRKVFTLHAFIKYQTNTQKLPKQHTAIID